MRTLRLLVIGAFAVSPLLVSNLAFAQEDGDFEEVPAEAEAEPEAVAEAAAPVSASAREVFPIRRGLYAAGDFGGYFSIGGRNTNVDGVPGKSVSNFQPMIGVTLGYDMVTSSTFNLALGLRVAGAYNAGSGRATAAEAVTADARFLPADFDLYHAGLAAKLGFMVLDRLAINGIVDVGLGVGVPDPTAPATAPDGGGTAIGVGFGVGAGIEFFTLFPGVSIGIDAKFVGSILASEFIPGLSFSAPLKYNF